MFALFIVLNKVDYLDEILAKFVSLGVGGATILDSQGMAGAIVDANNRVPILGMLKGIVDDSMLHSKTIFTLLENEQLVEKVAEAIQAIFGEEFQSGTGIMFSVPLGKIYRFQGTH